LGRDPAKKPTPASDVLHDPQRDAGVVALIEIADLEPGWDTEVQRLMRAAPTMRVVVFTLDATPEQVRRARQIGMHGYLLKQIDSFALASALRALAGGRRVFAPELTLAEPPGRQSIRPLSIELSRREREVLALLTNGLSNRAISARLCVSSATVKFHCGNIFAKLGVTNRAQAVIAAFRYDLVPRLVAESAEREHPLHGFHHEAIVRRA
jgi:DNA-binding NarL/FixJ family response regulator